MTSPQTSPKDDFYINYGAIPSSYRNFLLKFVPLLVIGALLFGFFLPGIHNQFNDGKINGGVELQGLLIAEPVPQLIVPRSGDVNNTIPVSRYILSAPNKAGVNPQILEQAGQWVKLTGTITSRNHLSLIAVRDAEPIAPPDNIAIDPDNGTSLGKFSLVGEIVDGKCYPGVMKPGQLKTHRSCAIRCISGGIPAVFRVQNNRDDVMYFLLADSGGKAVNDRVLDLVADPVQIEGEVIQYDDIFVIKADPETYKRV